jgi:hypothetical protein
MTSAKLDPATNSAATPRTNAAEQVGPATSKNSIKEPDSAIDTPPERTSGLPSQWNFEVTAQGRLKKRPRNSLGLSFAYFSIT